MTSLEFSSRLLLWYRENKRDLPWRTDTSPYRTWISEIMLQQTRVEAVKGYFERFLTVLPTVNELAAVPDEVLMKLWQGLGYYSRARNLKKAAQMIVAQHGGRLPQEFDALRKLPGIGSYTAGAIASMAFGKRVPAVDGNVLRVYARVFGDSRDIADSNTKKAYETAVLALMPEERGEGEAAENDCGDFNQGLIELGATVCLPNGAPLCERCPFADTCTAKREGSIDSLPVKSKKAPRRIEERSILLLTDGERYGLMKRPEKGLLASLFEPVNLIGRMSEEEIRSWLLARGFSPGTIVPIGQATHIFTHIEWQMTGYEVRLTDLSHASETVFATPDEIALEYAVPSAFRFFMRYISGKVRKPSE